MFVFSIRWLMVRSCNMAFRCFKPPNQLLRVVKQQCAKSLQTDIRLIGQTIPLIFSAGTMSSTLGLWHLFHQCFVFCQVCMPCRPAVVVFAFGNIKRAPSVQHESKRVPDSQAYVPCVHFFVATGYEGWEGRM